MTYLIKPDTKAIEERYESGEIGFSECLDELRKEVRFQPPETVFIYFTEDEDYVSYQRQGGEPVEYVKVETIIDCIKYYAEGGMDSHVAEVLLGKLNGITD